MLTYALINPANQLHQEYKLNRYVTELKQKDPKMRLLFENTIEWARQNNGLDYSLYDSNNGKL